MSTNGERTVAAMRGQRVHFVEVPEHAACPSCGQPVLLDGKQLRQHPASTRPEITALERRERRRVRPSLAASLCPGSGSRVAAP